ncbi:MAG: hypothetical protein R2831_07405 [Chitinophagaceae bacterium]
MKKNILFLSLLLLGACKPSDKKLLLGTWENENDWFTFYNNNTYDSGKDIIHFVSKQTYVIDEEKNHLSIYTKQKDETYYLDYKFIGEDTLSLRNSLSTSKDYVNFIRKKEKK